jgi:hypothetical protein
VENIYISASGVLHLGSEAPQPCFTWFRGLGDDLRLLWRSGVGSGSSVNLHAFLSCTRPPDPARWSIVKTHLSQEGVWRRFYHVLQDLPETHRLVVKRAKVQRLLALREDKEGAKTGKIACGLFPKQKLSICIDMPRCIHACLFGGTSACCKC